MNRYILSGLEFGPIVVERALRQMDSKTMDKPVGEGRFTPREVAAHLADWEPILYGRIKQGVDSPGSVLETYDAVDQHYAEADPFESAHSFAARRKSTVDYLKGLEAADWHKSVVHPEGGAMTVLEWVATIMGHDMYHIEQLTSVW